MTIFRGPGGGGNATTDSELNALTAISLEALASALVASDAATAAAASAGQALASELAAEDAELGAEVSVVSTLGSANDAALSEFNAAASALAAQTSGSAIALAASLAASGGSALVGYLPAGTGAVASTVQNKQRESISVKDFGAVGDGVTDDTAAFTAFEVEHTARDVDLMGLSYYVSVMPVGNQYFGGLWVLSTGTSRNRWQGAQLTGAGRVAFGDNALSALPIDYSVGSSGAVVALGYNAMANMTAVKKSIAIGANTQANGTISRDNIAIGDSALMNVQAVTADYNQSFLEGTRSIGIGGNAGYFVTSGYNITAIGRNAGQCLSRDFGATVYGSNAYAGNGPIGLSAEIENWAPSLAAAGTINYSVAIGLEAMNAGITDYGVAVGGRALKSNKRSSGNVAVGPDALRELDSGTWYNGGAYSAISIAGTYTQAGTTITLTLVAHTLVVGDVVIFRLLDGASQTFESDQVPSRVISVPNANQVTLTSPKSLTGSGTAQMYAKATAALQTLNGQNTIVGALCAWQMTTGVQNNAVGYRALNDVTTASRNNAMGFRALSGLTNAQYCTAIGDDSGRTLISGALSSGTGTNRTTIGYDSRVSGDNQVQLGNSASTTYVYGTVQNRSDLRDKADVRDTTLGLAFINALRPVDYKWDMREDYAEEYEEQIGIDAEGLPVFEPRTRQVERDGSHRRGRYHHGLIAQEVQQVIVQSGADFGGFQDHSKSGGCDVLSIGYDELIAPLIKAVQELASEVAALKRSAGL